MTRAAVRAAVSAATVAAALALPATGAAHLVYKEVKVTDVGYDPRYETLYPGQSIHWIWQTAGGHSVTSDPGQDETFSSGLRSSGIFEHVFMTPGVYTYRSTGTPEIAGTIEVLPYPTADPRIKRLRVSGGSKPIARFRSNARGDAVGRVEARVGGRWRTAKSFFGRARKGRNRMRVPSRGLDPGRHRLTLRIYDRFGRLDSARERFRI